MIPVLPPDLCMHHTVAMTDLPPAQTVQVPLAPMGAAAVVTRLVDATETVAGKPVRLPPQPELEVQEVTLAAGETLPVPPGLVQRHALVRSGALEVGTTSARAPQRFTAGQWVLDDGLTPWRAPGTPGAEPARLLVVSHVQRGRGGQGAQALLPTALPTPSPTLLPTPSPTSLQASVRKPGGESLNESMKESLKEPLKDPSNESSPRTSIQPLLHTGSDYTGHPIQMPDGPLRVMVHRYEIPENATLPWHFHPYQRYAYVERGRLQVEDRNGLRQVFQAADVLVEQRQVVHRGTNLGQEPVVLLVFDYLPENTRNHTTLAEPI
ncbi:cupin domain-containing protein [Roseateles sp. SL47]|uniref:cupin domain-containing protein n=1 Tax=Roseateles sp. SL47 TaxID=2995138 RepID=UPI00226F2309|nr:cupin domain-containing protein [Roseateles sp. SL47]WAC75129.1 cupin domain-containing protein [Roseateles sp. SL47]